MNVNSETTTVFHLLKLQDMNLRIYEYIEILHDGEIGVTINEFRNTWK